jgi:hypothetical protein
VGVATVAVGLIVEGATSSLGASLAPFFAHWEPQVDGQAIVAIPAFLAAVALAVLLARRDVPLVPFLLGALAATLVARLAVAAARDGVDGWHAIFGSAPEASNEYLPVLPAIDSLGLRTFLDRYAELSPTLPIHPSAHPPGTLVLLEALGIDTARGMAWLTIALGSLATPLTYALARACGLAESRSRAACLLLALSPAALLYGVTSTDAIFATAATAAAALLVARGLGRRIAGAIALLVASFLSWAMLAMGAFAAIVVWLREGLRPAIGVAALAAAALAAGYGALYAATGFDPIGAVRAAGDAYDLGISNARPYLFWLFGSPVAFAVALGLPTAWYAARALGAGEAVALALAAIVLVSVLVGLTKAETERIWLFMGPSAAVAAATMVPLRRMPEVLGILAAQALAVSLLLFTIW